MGMKGLLQLMEQFGYETPEKKQFNTINQKYDVNGSQGLMNYQDQVGGPPSQQDISNLQSQYLPQGYYNEVATLPNIGQGLLLGAQNNINEYGKQLSVNQNQRQLAKDKRQYELEDLANTQRMIDEVNAQFPIETVDYNGVKVELPPSAAKREALARIPNMDKYELQKNLVQGGVDVQKTAIQNEWEKNNETKSQREGHAVQREANTATNNLARAVNLQKTQLFDQEQVKKEYESDSTINNRGSLIHGVEQFLGHKGADTALNWALPDLPNSDAKAARSIIDRQLSKMELLVRQSQKGLGTLSDAEGAVISKAIVDIKSTASVADKKKALRQMIEDLKHEQGANITVHRRMFKKDPNIRNFKEAEPTEPTLPAGVKIIRK